MAPRGAEHQFLWHLLLRELNEVLATAMHWKDVLEIELLQFGHNLAQIICGCGRQMETAGKRVNLFDTADLLRPSQRIYNSGMAAGGNHDQAPVTQAEASCVFVPMLVGLRLASELVFAEMVVHISVRIAT